MYDFILLFKITKLQNNNMSQEENNITLQTLHDAVEHSEVMKCLSQLMPKWVEHIAEQYAPEYSELNKTWDDLCKKVNAAKNKILIVVYLPMKIDNENDRYIGMISDMLASKGYLLRRTSELIVCPNTGYALVSKKMHTYFKRHNNIFPKEWLPYAVGSDLTHNETTSELSSSEPSVERAS